MDLSVKLFLVRQTPPDPQGINLITFIWTDQQWSKYSKLISDL